MHWRRGGGGGVEAIAVGLLGGGILLQQPLLVLVFLHGTNTVTPTPFLVACLPARLVLRPLLLFLLLVPVHYCGSGRDCCR